MTQPTGGPERVAGLLRTQAEACAELGSPLYAGLLSAVADDVVTGGPAADIVAGHEDDPEGWVIGLRLMGAVHRLVLERRAPALALYFPSVGDTADPAAAWPALRALLGDEREAVRVGLLRHPQTNEVGRAAALVGGLLHIRAAQDLPIRLVEIGASAGLNLRADAFVVHSHTGGQAYGPSDSPVRLTGAWAGSPPPLGHLRVVERLGCDLAPVDPRTTQGRLTLTSYVWADMIARLERLRGALELAARIPARVLTASAGDLLDTLKLREGSTLAVWHSVMWQYVDAAERDRVLRRLDTLGATASPRAGLAHLSLEPRPGGSLGTRDMLVTLRTWPDGTERVLGQAPAHGLPVTWGAG
jgi:hypothetical protein